MKKKLTKDVGFDVGFGSKGGFVGFDVGFGSKGGLVGALLG